MKCQTTLKFTVTVISDTYYAVIYGLAAHCFSVKLRYTSDMLCRLTWPV